MSEATSNFYQKVPGNFYESEMKNANPLTQYYHNSRYKKIREFISTRFRKGMTIADLGSGSSSWNTEKLPVTAVDINVDMLEHGKRIGNIKNLINANLDEPLPIESNTFDFVVMSEVIEHLNEPGKQLKEARRILKKGGFLVITVPLDTFLSSWQILFEIGCFIRGDILGNIYFKKRCGHLQHFSIQSISRILEENDLQVIEKNITWLNIGIIAQKV